MQAVREVRRIFRIDLGRVLLNGARLGYNNRTMMSEALWSPFHDTLQSAFGLSLPEASLTMFERFYALLVEANRTTNLTRITSPEDFMAKHLLDSLSLALVFTREGVPAKIMDVGSGAGFPAIPLAIAYPEMAVTALEATGKKVQFIQQVAETLSLRSLMAVHARAESLARDKHHREAYPVVVSRAVAPLRSLCELMSPFVKPHGVMVAMKTHKALASEVPESQTAFKTLHLKPLETITNPLPELSHYTLWAARKTKATPAAYPRTDGLPVNKPL